MWSSQGFNFLAEANKVATPGWVIDTLHSYGEFFQKTFILNQILRLLGIQIIMIFYAIDSLFAKIIFTILGMSTASDPKLTGTAFNGTILGLLGDGSFQTLVKIGMGLGVSALGIVGIWIYLKMLIGKPVALGEVFTNLFTTAIIFIATPTLLMISLRGGAFVFGSLATRNFSTNPQTQEVTMTNSTGNLGDNFVWSFIQTDIVATGDAVTGQYLVNASGKRSQNTKWDDKTVQDDAANAADYNDIVKNNFPNDGRKQDIGAVATGEQIANFRSSFAARREIITASAGSWTAELMRRIPLPSDVQRKKDGNWWDKLVAAWEKTVEGSDRKSTWGLLAGYSYDYDTYNIQDKNQEEGSGSHLIPVSQGDFLPFSSGHYYYYSINWAVIITLFALFFLLFDIFYKLLIAFIDICATLLVGWGGMTATAESGRGNAIFIEEMLNYGKVCLVSGMSLGLYVVVTNFLKSMFATLKTAGTLNGIEVLVASPIVLLVVTFAFLNGSGAFIKFVGVDAGFSTTGGVFGALAGRRALKNVGGRLKEAAGGAMRKGINALSGNETEASVEKAAARDSKRFSKKASSIIKEANREKQFIGKQGNLSAEDHDAAMTQIDEKRDKNLETLANNKVDDRLFKKKMSAQSQAQQRLAVLRNKVDHGLATDEEQNEYRAMNLSRSGYTVPNLAQQALGVDAKSLSSYDSAGQRKGAIDFGRLSQYKERINPISSTDAKSLLDPLDFAPHHPVAEQSVETQAPDQTVTVKAKPGVIKTKQTNEDNLFDQIPLDATQNNSPLTINKIKENGTQEVIDEIQRKDIEHTTIHKEGNVVRENNQTQGRTNVPIDPRASFTSDNGTLRTKESREAPLNNSSSRQTPQAPGTRKK